MKKIAKVKNEIKYYLPDSIVHQMVFLKNYHRWINYENPTILDEKLLILKAQYANRIDIKNLIDKYQVRAFLKEKHLGNILNELYQVCDSVGEIRWESLPPCYVIKCNHGSGYNIIVRDSAKINKRTICNQLDQWLHEDYAVVSGEKQYKNIPPKIIIERYIEDKRGCFPLDYKFFVSRGNVIGCLLIDRQNTDTKKIFLNKNFEDMKFMEKNFLNYMDYKPTSWEKMKQIASELGKDFPFVRVDLYDKDGDVLFGELTFTPHGCIHKHISMEGQTYIGKRIEMT